MCLSLISRAVLFNLLATVKFHGMVKRTFVFFAFHKHTHTRYQAHPKAICMEVTQAEVSAAVAVTAVAAVVPWTDDLALTGLLWRRVTDFTIVRCVRMQTVLPSGCMARCTFQTLRFHLRCAEAQVFACGVDVGVGVYVRK
jgi:hypothetical protein